MGGYVQPGCEGASRGVFVNDGETLFRFEPSTRIMTRVANFEGCGTSVVDIAVDKHGAMYGITADGFVKIDSATADCTRIRDGVFPNSLSFVPEGTVYPDREALVGYLDQRYVVLDPGTGAMEQRDALPDSFFSAGGDVVSVAEGATYVAAADSSITDALGRSPYSLLRVDPASGKMLANVGRFDANAVFALAYWDGVVYAFTGDGRAVTFEEATGTMKLIHLDGMSLGSRFDGGASTTCSPLPKAP